MSDQSDLKALDDSATNVGNANNGYAAANGLRQMYGNATHTGMLGLPDKGFGLNDLARPFGLNYDEPSGPGMPAAEAGTPELAAERELAAPIGESAAPALEAGPEALAAEASATKMGNLFGGAGAGLGLVAGGYQAYDGYKRAFGAGATEQDEVHGGLDMAGGAAGVAAGGLGLATALGAGGAIAAASSVAAPVAAAIGLGVAGDHHAEEMGLFGHGADGKNQGAVEAAWGESQHLGDAADQALGGGTLGLIGGAATAGVSTAVLETGAAALDVGLGVDALGASSGMFGTAKNADGQTYNMGAFQAMDGLAHSAGDGVDNALGLDPDSTSGEIVGGITRGAIDVAEAPLALAANVGGALVGGAEAVGGWIGDLF